MDAAYALFDTALDGRCTPLSLTPENQETVTTKHILVTKPIPENGLQHLRQHGFELTIWQEDRAMNQEELIHACQTSQILLSQSSDRLDAHFFAACPHLAMVSQFAAGYDNIDLPAATRAGIPVANTPGAMRDATADIAFGLMIAASRKMFHMHKSIARGEWGSFRPTANLGIELRGKTLGIFGMGSIGQEMARRCRGAYEMDIIYHNRQPNPEAEQALGARWVPFEELLQKSDVLSVHCTLNDTTRGLFDHKVFAQMKPTALFINTARGAIHHEGDLVHALQSGRLWGAGLDVTNPEPMSPDHPLLSMETVAVLPHIGSSTVEARSAMAAMAAENITTFVRTGLAPRLLNPEYRQP